MIKSVARFTVLFMSRMTVTDTHLPWMDLSQANCTGIQEQICRKICPTCQHAMVTMMAI